jgi:hypothetical protein
MYGITSFVKHRQEKRALILLAGKKDIGDKTIWGEPISAIKSMIFVVM